MTRFICVLHAKRLRSIKIVSQLVVLCLCSLLLDNERWKQAEVPAEFQDLVNSIADGRISLPERKIPGTKKKPHRPADVTWTTQLLLYEASTATVLSRQKTVTSHWNLLWNSDITKTWHQVFFGTWVLKKYFEADTETKTPPPCKWFILGADGLFLNIDFNEISLFEAQMSGCHG